MTTRSNDGQGVLETTLLDLVSVIGSVENSDEVLVARVVELVKSGGVKLTGNFRDVPIERLFVA